MSNNTVSDYEELIKGEGVITYGDVRPFSLPLNPVAQNTLDITKLEHYLLLKINELVNLGDLLMSYKSHTDTYIEAQEKHNDIKEELMELGYYGRN